MFSVIIPCYKPKKELFEKCINSIIDQSYSDFEVILIDDGNNEEDLNLIKSICSDNRFKIYSQKNGGVSKARNHGIEKATGDYLTFVDCDDFLNSSMFEIANDVVSETNCDIFYAGVKNINTKDDIIPDDNVYKYEVYLKNQINEFKKRMIDRKHNIELLDNGIISRGPVSRFVKREIAKNTLFYEDMKLGEDIIWNQDLLGKADKIVIYPKSLYYYVNNSESASNKISPQVLNNPTLVIDRLHKYIDFSDSEAITNYLHAILEAFKYNFVQINNTNMSKNEKKHLFDMMYNNKSVKNIINHSNRIADVKSKIKLCMIKYRLYFTLLKIRSNL